MQRLPDRRGVDAKTPVSPRTPGRNPPGVSRTSEYARDQPHLWRVPENPGDLDKKKFRPCHPCARRSSPRRRMTSWKWMRSGHLGASGRGNAGCGPSCAGGRDKCSPSCVAITANERVVGCGIAFCGPIGRVSVSAISGRRMPRCSRSKRTAASAKRPEKPPIWNVATIPYANAMRAPCGTRCRFRNLFAGMIESPSGL